MEGSAFPETLPTHAELKKTTKRRLLKAAFELVSLTVQRMPSMTWREYFEIIAFDYTDMIPRRIPKRVYDEWVRDPWKGFQVIGRRMEKEDIINLIRNLCERTTWKRQVTAAGDRLTYLTYPECFAITRAALLPPKKAIALRRKRTKKRQLKVRFRPGGPGAAEAARQFKSTLLDVLCADLSDDSTVPQLRAMAKALKMTGYSRMNKAQLCDAISFELLPVYLT